MPKIPHAVDIHSPQRIYPCYFGAGYLLKIHGPQIANPDYSDLTFSTHQTKTSSSARHHLSYPKISMNLISIFIPSRGRVLSVSDSSTPTLRAQMSTCAQNK